MNETCADRSGFKEGLLLEDPGILFWQSENARNDDVTVSTLIGKKHRVNTGVEGKEQGNIKRG